MDSRHTTGKPVCGIEQRRVGIGYLYSQSQQRTWNFSFRPCALTLIEQVNGFSRPARPMAKQTANNWQSHLATYGVNRVFRQQVSDNVVIIAGVERYVLGAVDFRDRADHLQCLIAVEGSYLNRDHVRDLNKTTPETE
jgi:hypothetical protein